jgi:hypothetical protein
MVLAKRESLSTKEVVSLSLTLSLRPKNNPRLDDRRKGLLFLQ